MGLLKIDSMNSTVTEIPPSIRSTKRQSAYSTQSSGHAFFYMFYRWWSIVGSEHFINAALNTHSELRYSFIKYYVQILFYKVKLSGVKIWTPLCLIY